MLDAGAVTFHRVPYDVAKAAAAIRATQLPHEFAADIETGGAPLTRPGAITDRGCERQHQVSGVQASRQGHSWVVFQLPGTRVAPAAGRR